MQLLKLTDKMVRRLDRLVNVAYNGIPSGPIANEAQDCIDTRDWWRAILLAQQARESDCPYAQRYAKRALTILGEWS